MITNYRNEISKRTIRNAPQSGRHHGEGPTDGAQRNARIASVVAARKAAREDDKEKKIADRTAAAEKRKKETLAMATEESLTEELHSDYKLVKTGKKSTGAHPDGKPIYDVHHKGEKVATLSPISAYKDKKIPGKRYVASRKDITKYAIDSNANGLRFNSHNRYHNNAKDATEYFVQQHQQALKEESVFVIEETQTHVFHAHIKPLHKDDKVSKVVLKVKASNKNEATNKASKHLAKNYGVGNVSSVVHKGIMEETGTEARTKIKNVARPGDAEPTSKDSTLVKTGEIKKKKIDEGRSMSINRNFGLSESLIAATRALLEKKDADDSIKSVGVGKGKTEVDTKPQTDDQVNDGDDAPEKKSKKKKLDPVGKEDDDIDNDGDTDKSDKYLHGRRKAIGKAMKEEAEQIDELKHNGILSRYIRAVRPDVDDDVASPKRKAGYHMALKKKWGDKKYGFDEPRVKATNEEAEQIDELKKSTLASYTKKASNDATKHSYMAGKTGDVDTAAKASKRIRGIDMATNKLAKEEFSDAELARLEEIAAKFS